MKKLYLLIIILFFAVSDTKGQYPDWIVYHIHNSDLPNQTVFQIIEDENGIKWIGSYGGLLKIDDTVWTVYNSSNSGLTNNTLRSIEIDANGIKWIGNSGGVTKFDGTNWDIYSTSNSDLPHNVVRAIAIDPNGVKWIATDDGLAKLEDTTWTVYTTSNSGLPGNKLQSIKIDAYGNKWIGTAERGLAKFDDSTWTVYNNSNSSLPHNHVRSIAIEANGDLWIGTPSGLANFDGKNWKVHKVSNSDLPSNIIYSIIIDENGDKWIGAYNHLVKYDGTDWVIFSPANTGLPGTIIMSILYDKNRDLWVGTTDYGIAILKANKDISVEEILEVSDSVCGFENFEVNVKLKNNSNTWLKDFDVTAIISGDITDTITSTFTKYLSSGDSSNFTVGTFNSGQGGNIEILVYTSMPVDIDRSNDTLHSQAYFYPYPAIPDVPDDSLCLGEVVTLTGTNTGSLTKWYLPAINPILLHTGSSFTTPAIFNTMGYYVVNYSENNCPSERKEVLVTVNSIPNVPAIVQGVMFEGSWNAGTIQEPDEFCVGNTVSYEFPPPSGYNNSEFGDKWGVSVSLMTSDGYFASSFIFNDPDANTNANLFFTASTTEADSIFRLTAEYILYPSLCSKTVNRYVKVNPLPEVDFTIDEPCENSTTSFTSISTIPLGNLIAYEWDFGDGNTSTFLGPVNTYFAKGTYSVRLKVTSDALCVNETTKEIDIYEMPQADFEVSLACAMNSFSFINLSSYSKGSEELNYEWDFGINNETSTDFEPEYKYVNPDTYMVSLKVISPDGCMNLISKNIQVLDKPHAEFEVEDACAGSDLILNNKSTGNELISHWSFGDGKESTDYEPEHSYETPGEYEIILTVTDANGCSDQFTSQINIFELADAGFTYEEYMGKAKFTPNNETYSSYKWDFGDGNVSTEIAPEHEYAENGNYEVSLKVEDANGCINEEIMSITLSTVSLESITHNKSLNLIIYPNPFNNEAIISYELHENTEISIVLYDLTGRQLAVLEKAGKTAGVYTIVLNTKDTAIAAGVYMLFLQAGEEFEVRRIISLD